MQLDLYTEMEPDTSSSLGKVCNELCSEYKELIRRYGKWSLMFRRLLFGDTMIVAKVVDGFLYLLSEFGWQLVIPDYLNIKVS